jgi:hypothetical protein
MLTWTYVPSTRYPMTDVLWTQLAGLSTITSSVPVPIQETVVLTPSLSQTPGRYGEVPHPTTT